MYILKLRYFFCYFEFVEAGSSGALVRPVTRLVDRRYPSPYLTCDSESIFTNGVLLIEPQTSDTPANPVLLNPHNQPEFPDGSCLMPLTQA